MSESAPTSPFAPTRWTLVLRARGESAEARAALSDLCAAYYDPVFRFLRREGRDEDAARELTQEFFARLLAGSGICDVEPGRGRFRSFLLGAVKHFLADRRDREQAAKRGEGQTFSSLDAAHDTSAGPEEWIGTGPPPDAFFDRQWALTLMARALAALEAEFAEKSDSFTTLKPWLVGETEGLSQAEAGRLLGLTEGAVKVAIHRMRKRFRDLVRAEIAQTVSEPAQAEAELRYLVEVLATC